MSLHPFKRLTLCVLLGLNYTGQLIGPHLRSAEIFALRAVADEFFKTGLVLEVYGAPASVNVKRRRLDYKLYVKPGWNIQVMEGRHDCGL